MHVWLADYGDVSVMGAGAWYLFQVLFVPKRPGEHVCQIEVIAQSMNPTLEPTSSVLQVRAIAEVPHIQVVTVFFIFH